jgi:nicotinamidase-related amidase
MIRAEKSAIVLIDVQGELAQQMFEKESLFNNIKILVQGVKLFNMPIIWTEQVPAKLGPTVLEIAELLHDNKPIEKNEFSCFRNNEFLMRQNTLGITNFFLAGIEAHICVYQTAIDLLKAGNEVDVIVDAVSSRNELNKNIGIERIIQSGGRRTTVETLLFEIQKVAEGKRFKELINLIK